MANLCYDFQCPNRTDLGGCKLTACSKPSVYATNASAGVVGKPCKWMDNETEVCVNADCPMCCDFCPVADNPGVCRYEDRSGTQPQREDV